MAAAPAPVAEKKDAAPQKSAEFSKLTKIQKLAALLVMLGEEPASSILKNFEEHEVETISGEMAKIDMIPFELQAELLREFSDVAVQAGTSVLGGLGFTRIALQRALGEPMAKDIMSRVAPVRTPVAALRSIEEMDARQIYNLVRQEEPQTIALVLSYVKPEKAAQVFEMMPPGQRDLTVERLATLAPTPLEIVEKVVEVLSAKAGVRQARPLSQAGGVQTAADILNAMNKGQSQALLMTIEQRNPELTKAIRQKMFTFEDLTMLEIPTLQRILRDVEMRDLALAMKTASEKLKGMLLGSVSKRAADSIKEEIAFMTSVKLRDVEAAQYRIIETVRRLEAEGEIELGESQDA